MGGSRTFCSIKDLNKRLYDPAGNSTECFPVTHFKTVKPSTLQPGQVARCRLPLLYALRFLSFSPTAIGTPSSVTSLLYGSTE
jgi:hypothetical protein